MGDTQGPVRANEECPQGQRWVKEGCSGWGLGRGLKGWVENSQHREDETERGAEPQKQRVGKGNEVGR